MPNECGECTVCCTLCVVPEINKEAGEDCINCDKGGCQIYGDHPKSCKDFNCAYLEGGKDLNLRPDKCGVMFFKKSEELFCGVIVQGRQATALAGGQVRSFNSQGYSVILMKIGEKPHIVPAPGKIAKKIYKEYMEKLEVGNL